MNMISELRELNDNELDLVAGGMDCKSSMAVAQVYILTAEALGALGNSAGSAAFSGRAQGVLEGGCHK